MRLFLLIVMLACLVGSKPAGAQPLEIVQPNKDLSPEDVVFIQLHALGQTHEDDGKELLAGLAQVWALAHPLNRHILGPFPRFAKLIMSPKYRALLAHRSFHLEQVSKDDDEALFAVRVTGHNGGVYGYSWQVNKVSRGIFKDAWLTTSVKLVAHLGHAI